MTQNIHASEQKKYMVTCLRNVCSLITTQVHVYMIAESSKFNNHIIYINFVSLDIFSGISTILHRVCAWNNKAHALQYNIIY